MGNLRRLTSLYPAARDSVRQEVVRRWDKWPFRQVGHLSERYLRVWRNDDNNMHRNGEQLVLEQITFDSPPVVFDVGANRGDWAALVLELHPLATIHCFEPAPATARQLAQRFEKNRSVTVHAAALSDHIGTAALFDGPDDSQNSLVPRGMQADAHRSTPVVVLTGDQTLSQLGLDRVDLLKIDTEGHDLTVLRGFEKSLQLGRIPIIQFEYNGLSIYSRTLLLDFYEYLGPLGYRIGKLRPTGVRFKQYSLDDENWIGPDCVAVHNQRSELVSRLDAASNR